MIMNTPLQNRFETQLKALTGFDFQDMVIKIFQMKYGETGFTDIRPQKDKGNDGIVESEKRIIACYGPEENQNTAKRLKDFETKAKGDFEQYKTHWQAQYPNWSIVINHKIDPQYDKVVKGLNDQSTVVGISQLLTMIANLKNHQRRQLGAHLRIEAEFFSSEYLREFLDDLLQASEIKDTSILYDKKGYVPPRKKMELNYGSSEIQDAINEFEFLSESGVLKQVDDMMSCYEDEEIDRMKHRILYDYSNQTNGSFKERLKQLSEFYLGKYSSNNDDDYLHYIRAVLINLFEQCLIGFKTEQEQ